MTGCVLHAAPQLRLSQTVVGPLSVAQGGTADAVVDAFNSGDGNLSLQVSSAAQWISASLGAQRECPLRASLCTPVNIRVRTEGLARGTYTGTVTVSDPNALDAPQTITVTAAVGGGVPERADFYLAPNGSRQDLRFTSGSLLSTTATTQNNQPWLSIATEGAGSFRFGSPVPYRITATHLPSLGEGSYTGQIAITGSSVAAENRNVPVTLRITSQPIAQVSPERLEFRIAQGSAKQLQHISLTNRGMGTLSISGVTVSQGANWLTAERLPEANFVRVTADPAGLSAGTNEATVRIASNAAQGEIAVPVRLTVIPSGAPLLSYNGLVNNATFEGGDVLGQGAIVALFGEQLITGEQKVAASLPLGQELGGVRVFVNDQPAPVYFASYGQVNFQIPYNAQPGDAVIRVERDGQRSNRISARIVRSAPRLLRLGIGDHAIAVNQDGSFPIPETPGLNSHPAKEGDTLVVYAIGLGPTNPSVESGVASPASPLARTEADFRVVFGFSGPFGGSNVEAVPLFVGLTPGFVGLYQINVTIPKGVSSGNAVPMRLFSTEGASNIVTVAIR